MLLYRRFANELLKLANSTNNEWYEFDEDNFKYGFTYRRNYTGLMAYIDPKYIRYAKEKQGYFDFIGVTGPWFKISHDTLLKELLKTATLDECESIWRGKLPDGLTKEKKRILKALAILMFEQEVNFGMENWQRKSHFNPTIGNPKERRPRDLLMGYIRMVYYYGNVESVASFKNTKGLLLPPSDTEIKKEFFEYYENDSEAEVLMYGDILQSFKSHIETKDINRFKKEYYQKLNNKMQSFN